MIRCHGVAPFCALGQQLLSDIKRDDPHGADGMEDSCLEKFGNLKLDPVGRIMRSRRHQPTGGTMELIAEGRLCTVVLNDTKILSTHSTDFDLIDAFWFNRSHSNDEEVEEDVLCLLGVNNVQFCYAVDDIFVLPLPFPIEKGFPTSCGIILQRHLVEADIAPGREDVTPRILSVNHALGDVTAVMYNRPAGKTKRLAARFITSPCVLVMFVCQDLNVALLFDTRNQIHSLWHVRRATLSDTKSAMSLLEESICSVSELPVFRSSLSSSGRKTTTLSSHASNTGSSGLHPFSVYSSSTGKWSSNDTSSKQSQPTASARSINLSTAPLSSYTQSPKISTPTQSSSNVGSSSKLPSFMSKTNNPVSSLSPVASVSNKLSSCGSATLSSGLLCSEATSVMMDASAIFSAKGDLPNLTLDPLWTEESWLKPANFLRKRVPCHKAFATKDFGNRIYICYLLLPQGELRCIECECHPGRAGLRFAGQLHAIDSCQDADGSIVSVLRLHNANTVLTFQHANTMIILDSSFKIVIYSGMSKIGTLSLKSSDLLTSNSFDLSTSGQLKDLSYSSVRCVMQPPELITSSFTSVDATPKVTGVNPNASFLPVTPGVAGVVCSLGSGSSSAFVLNLVSGNVVKAKLPPISTCSLVLRLIEALRCTLRKSVVCNLLAKWYIASQNYTIRLLHLELRRFLRCLVEMVGFEADHIAALQLFSVDNQNSLSNAEPSACKKVKVETQASDEAWRKLVRCQFDKLLPMCKGDDLQTSNTENVDLLPLCTRAPLFSCIGQVYFALYCFYEELKLERLNGQPCQVLAEVLLHFCHALKLDRQRGRYLRESGATACSLFSIPKGAMEKVTASVNLNNCLGAFEFVDAFLSRSSDFALPIYVASSCDRLASTLLLFLVISSEWQESMVLSELMRFVGTTSKRMQRLGNLLATEKSAYNVVRAILVETPELYNWLPPSLLFFTINYLYDLAGPECFTWLQAYAADAHTGCQHHANQILSLANEWTEPDERHSLDKLLERLFTKERFRSNYDLWDLRNMFNYARVVTVEIQKLRPWQGTRKEYMERLVWKTVCKKLSCPVGLGMLTLWSVKPGCVDCPPVVEPCTQGYIEPLHTSVRLKRFELSSNSLLWPKFNSGVAAALAFRPPDQPDLKKEDPYDKSWIEMWLSIHLPKLKSEKAALSYEECGFILGLGLSGYLRRLSLPDYHRYLTQCNPVLSSAILLGVSADMVGTGDLNVLKMIAPHVPFLIPATVLDLSVDPLLQTTATVSLGLLYCRSTEMKMCRHLLDEIEQPSWAARDAVNQRESYALCCGFAFGLLTLGQGSVMLSTLEGKEITERLVQLIMGTREMPSVVNKRLDENYLIKESSMVSMHISSIPAIVAVGLSFLRTHNELAAGWLVLPERVCQLERIRPDAVMFRVLCHSLIMWNDIRADFKWLDTVLPTPMRKHLSAIPSSRWNMLDHETVGQVYVYALAGAALAIGFKFLGTGCATAVDTLLRLFNMFYTNEHERPLVQKLLKYVGTFAEETCASVTLLSLAMVTVGSGNSTVISIARALLNKQSNHTENQCGVHLVAHMAIAIQYLGAGWYSFKSDDLSIACLLVAFCPRFPAMFRDNRNHPQMLRHLYVMAAERRFVSACDEVTGAPVAHKISWTYRQGVFHDTDRAERLTTSFQMDPSPMRPLPQLDWLDSVRIEHWKYWPVQFSKQDSEQWQWLCRLAQGKEKLHLRRRTLPMTGSTSKFSQKRADKAFAKVASDNVEYAMVADHPEVENLVYTLLSLRFKKHLSVVDMWQVKLVDSYFRWREKMAFKRQCLVRDAVALELRHTVEMNLKMNVVNLSCVVYSNQSDVDPVESVKFSSNEKESWKYLTPENRQPLVDQHEDWPSES